MTRTYDTFQLCLIIDNTQSYLRDWLALTRLHKGKLTPELAEFHFRFRMKVTTCPSPSLRRDVIDFMCERILWEDVAEHYNTKVAEGATA